MATVQDIESWQPRSDTEGVLRDQIISAVDNPALMADYGLAMNGSTELVLAFVVDSLTHPRLGANYLHDDIESSGANRRALSDREASVLRQKVAARNSLVAEQMSKIHKLFDRGCPIKQLKDLAKEHRHQVIFIVKDLCELPEVFLKSARGDNDVALNIDFELDDIRSNGDRMLLTFWQQPFI